MKNKKAKVSSLLANYLVFSRELSCANEEIKLQSGYLIEARAKVDGLVLQAKRNGWNIEVMEVWEIGSEVFSCDYSTYLYYLHVYHREAALSTAIGKAHFIAERKRKCYKLLCKEWQFSLF